MKILSRSLRKVGISLERGQMLSSPPRRSNDHWVTWYLTYMICNIFTYWWFLFSNLSLWQIHVLLSYVANLRHHLITNSMDEAFPGDIHCSILGALLPSDPHLWSSLHFPCLDFHTSGSNTFVWWFYILLRSKWQGSINIDMPNNGLYRYLNNIGNNDLCNRSSVFSSDLSTSTV